MRRWTRRLVPVAVFIAMGAVVATVTLQVGRSDESDPILFEVDEAPSHTPISLLEAYDLATTFAADWEGSWSLQELSSSTHPDDALDAGADGRRDSWLATFASAGGDQRAIEISGAQVVRALVLAEGTGTGNAPPWELERPALNSTSATVLNAFKDAALGPSQRKSPGIHFTLTRDSLLISEVLVVLGAQRGNPARVVLRMDGQLVAVEHYGIVNSRVGLSNDAGRSWVYPQLPGDPISIAPEVGGSPGAFVALALNDRVEVGSLTAIGVYVPLATLPPSVHWVRAMQSSPEYVFIATNDGLWSAQLDSGGTVKEEPLEVIDLAIDPDGTPIAVAVDDVQQTALYARIAEHSWQRVAGAAPERIARVGDRLLEYRRDRALGTLPSMSDAAGGAGPTLALSPASELLVESANGGWDEVAIADGPQQGVAIEVVPMDTGRNIVIGEFRGGLWVSHDEGVTWDRTADVEGTLGDLAYLGGTTLASLEIGEAGWEAK